MKVSDYIAESIMEWPSLFKSMDYDQSKLKVLNQIFFVIGNGLDFAQTGDEKTGGYVVSPRHRKKNGRYIRIKDKPYGVETHSCLPEGYFETKIYETRDYGIVEQCARYGFSPYPFSKDYSLACKVYYNDVKLQPDWMEELVILCKETLRFFNSEEDVKGYTYYPRPGSDNKKMEFFINHRETQLQFINSFLTKFGN